MSQWLTSHGKQIQVKKIVISLIISYFRCRTDTDELKLKYKYLFQTQDMLNKTSTKVDNIIRK